MSDLISREVVIDVLKQTGIIQDNDLGHLVIDEINRIPTAYDVEKVVEELKEWSFETEIVIPTSDGFEDTVNREIICTLNAIDIVRKGGVDE